MQSILATAWTSILPAPNDVIVVSSGYAGAITAAHPANVPVNPKLKICLEGGNGRLAASLTPKLWAPHSSKTPVDIFGYKKR